MMRSLGRRPDLLGTTIQRPQRHCSRPLMVGFQLNAVRGSRKAMSDQVRPWPGREHRAPIRQCFQDETLARRDHG